MTTEDRGFKVVEAFGSESDIEFLISDAVSIALWTGSVGADSRITDTEGNIKASVSVERVGN
jgi:hypothetical protein